MEKVLIYDQEKCAGCRSCVVGCSLYHDGECSKILSRINVVRNERYGESFVAGCDLCTDPPCAAVCPTGALSVTRPEMKVDFNQKKCSICELCVPACPTRAMQIRPTNTIFFE